MAWRDTLVPIPRCVEVKDSGIFSLRRDEEITILTRFIKSANEQTVCMPKICSLVQIE